MVDTSGIQSQVVDDEYKSAIQPVVDNNMRTDILGPHFCNVIKNHTPASTAIITLITEKISTDPKLKAATKSVIAEHNKDTKIKWVDRAVGAMGTIVLALVIWGVQTLITK